MALAFAACGCGCGDACFQFSSNSGTGTIQIVAGENPCRTSKPLGAAQFRIGSSLASAPPGSSAVAPGSATVRHIFVTVRGIEGQEDPSATPSGDWRQLAPDLAEHPVEVDLLAPLLESAAFPVAASARVPAGVYRQIRLQLLPGLAAHSNADRVAAGGEPAACGGFLRQCAVLADGAIRPLLLSAEGSSETASALRISSEQISGGTLIILPDARRTYQMRFEPLFSVSSTSGDAVRLIPVFFVSPQ